MNDRTENEVNMGTPTAAPASEELPSSEGSRVAECDACFGGGEVVAHVADHGMVISETCPVCNGHGVDPMPMSASDVGEDCPGCGGIGRRDAATRATSEEGNATGTPGSEATNTPEYRVRPEFKRDEYVEPLDSPQTPTPKVEDSVVEVGGEGLRLAGNLSAVWNSYGLKVSIFINGDDIHNTPAQKAAYALSDLFPNLKEHFENAETHSDFGHAEISIRAANTNTSEKS